MLKQGILRWILKQWKLWLGLIISVVAVWFVLRDIDFKQVGEAFGNLNWWLFGLSFIPYFISLFLKVTRWQLLFHPGPRIRLYRLWATLMISYLFNTVLPARLGEVVRGYALSRSEKIGTVRVLSTILLEKILDVMTMFIFLVALLPFLNLDDGLKKAGFIMGGVFVSAFIVCMLMAAYRPQAEKLVGWFIRPLPENLRTKLMSFLNEVLDVVVLLLNFKVSLNLWAQSFLEWVLVVLNYMMIAWALNLPLTFEQAMVLMIALNLGMAVPSAPGYIGVFEALVVAALSPFYPDQKSLVISMGFLLHIGGFLPVILMGAYCTFREGVSVDKLTQAAEPETTLPEPTPVASPPPADQLPTVKTR